MQPPNRILVVDDEPAARAWLEEVLSDAGFVCDVAGSGHEALALLDRRGDVAVVVSDVAMPELDGVRLGRFIRDRYPARPWLQVLFVTAHAEVELAVSALRLGAVDYLTKPVAGDALVAAVGRALSASRAIHASQRSNGATPYASGDLDERRASRDAAARSALEYLAGVRRLRQESDLLRDLDEASWTIMLEVYRAEMIGRRLSVSKLCTLDEASQTTAWRRIRAMSEQGLLVRDQDPADARRSFVQLSEEASSAVAGFMARAEMLLAQAS